MHGNDTRVFQATGDLRLQQEARPAFGVVGVQRLDFLESHLSVQFLVVGDVDLTDPSPGVEPQAPVSRGPKERAG
jgi:hypothetical protein